MGKAIKCPACGSFYNGSIYCSCPYCTDSGAKSNTAPVSEKRETKGIFGLFGKNKTGDQPAGKDHSDVTSAEQSDDTAPAGESAVPDASDKIRSVDVRRETRPLFGDATAQSDTPAQQDTKHVTSLSQAISRSGRTVGKYISGSSGESIAPVVGWLVGVQGAYHGQSFNLKSGRNKVGRSHEMDVKLLNDDSVSRASVAVIVFDAKAGEFSILPGESDSLCYVNNTAVYERVSLSGYEEIEFGDAGLNKYIFVPFCGERFSWADHNNTQNK